MESQIACPRRSVAGFQGNSRPSRLRAPPAPVLTGLFSAVASSRGLPSAPAALCPPHFALFFFRKLLVPSVTHGIWLTCSLSGTFTRMWDPRARGALFFSSYVLDRCLCETPHLPPPHHHQIHSSSPDPTAMALGDGAFGNRFG